MPFLPKDITSECFELRYAPNSRIYNNTCIGGSIGISVVANDYVRTWRNQCSKQKEEGIEYANSNNGMIKDNTIFDQASLGILIDGFAPSSCAYDTLLNNKISGKTMGVQLYKDTHDIYIRDCDISATSKVINIQGAHDVMVHNCHLSGSGGTPVALFLDNSPGNVTMKGGTMTNVSHKFFIYGTKQIVTDNILLDGVKVSGGRDFDQRLSGGASAGTNIKVK
jgi:parallel beta-helix repeat protein